MKTSSLSLAVAILLALACQIATSLNLYVIDPRNSFVKYPGTIEDMRMTVQPHGSFMEMGVYITFSPVGSIYSSVNDTLEAVLEFELNQKAFINDMWLFLNDTVMIRARLMDKWTAGFIYEGIVRRRLDPSILTKVADGKYMIRVFPLIGNSTRTVKINMFVPTDWTFNSITSVMPIGFLKASHKKSDVVKVYAYTDSAFVWPYFPEMPDLPMYETYNPRYGVAYMGYVPVSNGGTITKITYRHSFGQGIFANFQTGEKENFYQFIIEPTRWLNLTNPKRVAFMIDYDSDKSNISRKTVFEDLRKAIYNNFNPTDSFNIFIAGKPILKISDKWIAADSVFVEAVFASINPDTLPTKTHLPDLLYTGVKWANDNADTAMIVILSNTDMHGSQDSGNTVGSKVLELNRKKFKINPCSFIQKNWRTYVISGQNWAGNNYLYNSLASLTQGVFNKIPESGNSVYHILVNTFNNQIGGFENLSLHATFSDGYSYDKVNFENNSLNINTAFNLIEFGKYFGELPAYVELSGYYRSMPFRKMLPVYYDPFMNLYDNRSMWAATTIRKMELERNSGKFMMWDIVNKSVEYKVLSLFTAFLATEDDKLDTIPKDEDLIVPVEMVYFDAIAREKGIDLFWATATEENNLGFYIDRKLYGDDKDWNTIEFVQGFGNSKIVREYNYFDGGVSPNNVYQYRLRQIDLDGTIDYVPKILTVAFQYDLELSLDNYPNPMRDETTIRFTVPHKSQVRLEIFDVLGNSVAAPIDKILDAGQYDILWNGMDSSLGKLQAGIYLCKLQAGGSIKTIKIIITN